MIARKIAVHNRLLPINCCLGACLEDWLIDEFLVLGLFPFQNWMLLAVGLVAFSIAVSVCWVRD